jgi:hypothetical protein
VHDVGADPALGVLHQFFHLTQVGVDPRARWVGVNGSPPVSRIAT